jgi:3-dehydroquinate synthase
MSTIVHVDLGERSYDIRIGTGLSPGDVLKEAEGQRVLIVSDSNVDPLYGERCEQALQAVGRTTFRAVVPAGEASKDLGVARHLYTEAVVSGLDRGSLIVALGGGMVGDLAGFVAATFLRGIGLVQAPTSLLAMVDSSVGGKTGVNLQQGKNLVGSFYQPLGVVADLAALATLPEREYVSGLAEVVKYGVIWDAEFFGRLESQVDKLLKRDIGFLEEVVARCCEIKAEVVAIDEREGGVRAILNFGHTLGHALEQVAGYSRWLHGEAVAAGMVYAASLSSRERGLSRGECDRLVDLLDRLGLPECAELLGAVSWNALREAMSTDKKTRGAMPRLVLAERLGSVVYGCEVSETTLEESFAGLPGAN